MSEFLMVIPPGWTEVPWKEPDFLADDILRALASSDNVSLNMCLQAGDAMPVGKKALDAKLFNTGETYRFWVLYADI